MKHGGPRRATEEERREIRKEGYLAGEEIMLVAEKTTELIIGAAVKVHRELGPGLLESVYEVCLAHEIAKSGLKVQKQIDVPIR